MSDVAGAPGETIGLEADFASSLGHTISDAQSLPLQLRTALAFTCTSERPVHSVNQLARTVGTNRRTLWHQWRKVVGPSTVRLQDFLHWILLLRATGVRRNGQTWQLAAQSVGVHEHTLARYSKHLIGKLLSQLDAEDEISVVQAFEKHLLGSLFRIP